jgi:hypothetical protein
MISLAASIAGSGCLPLISVISQDFQNFKIFLSLALCRRNISGQEFGGMYCVLLTVRYIAFHEMLVFFSFQLPFPSIILVH